MTRAVSKFFGKIAEARFPAPIQRVLNKNFVKSFNISLDEFKSIEEYKSLNELFTRSLVKQREIDISNSNIISPADAKFLECAKVEQGGIYQVKGYSYSIDELFGFETDKKYEGFDFLNFYLSPQDYHRFHAPCDIEVERLIYIPGSLYPVNAPALKRWPKLFSKNERVVLEGVAPNREKIFLVFVGALNVGKIEIVFEPKISTNSCKGDTEVYKYENLTLKKGDEIGHFKMGSSIVMVLQNFTKCVETPSKVRFGQIIGTI